MNNVFKNGHKSKSLCLIDGWNYAFGKDILKVLKKGMQIERIYQ